MFGADQVYKVVGNLMCSIICEQCVVEFQGGNDCQQDLQIERCVGFGYAQVAREYYQCCNCQCSDIGGRKAVWGGCLLSVIQNDLGYIENEQVDGDGQFVMLFGFCFFDVINQIKISVVMIGVDKVIIGLQQQCIIGFQQNVVDFIGQLVFIVVYCDNCSIVLLTKLSFLDG